MKLWDGRFSKATDSLMDAFNASLACDHVMIEEDIDGSIAWAGALKRAGVLTDEECSTIVDGLGCIRDEYREGTLAFLPTDEDIHMAVERILTEKVGAVGAKLHTGRSRNDQVVTDFRLFVKKRLDELTVAVTGLQRTLLACAERDAEVIAPGYTHLQQAQPVALAHYWLSLLFGLEREKGRLVSARRHTDIMPLGSGALAGSGFAVDRTWLARVLGFAAVSDNSMDAVAGRDFVLESLACCSSLGILLSRHAEDLIVWSSKEFGFVELDDAWATGSSMMPQKKNPDSLELVRGKAGRLIGNYTRFAATLKGVGLTYYKDLQEDKETLFDSLATVSMAVRVFAGVVGSLAVRRERMAETLDPMLLATDVADYLVEKGIAFREAHHVVGGLVRHALDKGVALSEVPLEKLKSFSAAFDEDVRGVFEWRRALSHRDVAGGTGPASVTAQLATARKLAGQ
jgi:argininosuccinate lyase